MTHSTQPSTEVVYEVTVVKPFGDLDFRKLFKNEQDARRCYEGLIADAKKNEDRVKPDDEHGKNFVRTKGDDEFYPNRIEACGFKYWYKSSYEYDEYDVAEDTIVLSTVNVY